MTQGSDLVIMNSKEKLDVVAGRYGSISGETSSKDKFKLLRLMHTPLNVSKSIMKPETIREISSIPHHRGRKNILFVGNGNNEVDYQALMWYDMKMSLGRANPNPNPNTPDTNT